MFRLLKNFPKFCSKPLFPSFSTSKVPLKTWTSSVEPIEEEASKQLQNLCSLGPDIIHGHIAVMPDVHWGMGATVGSVIPTKHVIIPAAVGVDIGCGMCAVKTSLFLDDFKSDSLAKIRNRIESVIPVGFAGIDDKKFNKEFYKMVV